MPYKIAVLISGSGSNLQAIIDRIEQNVLDARITRVISNKPGVAGLERAERHGLSTTVIEHKDYPSREDFDAALVRTIKDSGAEGVILAGFMRIITPVLINAFPGNILNIHPSIQPAFPGVHAQKQAAEYAVKLSGCSIHFVDEKMDHGPIIIQAAVPALAGDDEKSLGSRILALEHRIFPQAVQWLAQNRLEINGRTVNVLNAPSPAAVEADTYPSLVSPGLEDGF
ncbi:phosphoribosylglycinamide formyltransferase [Desulfonatronospira sp.]|uniref:phosphoribosylglycinamide formyltransferase n=1 Tax=Desulfonatronospira sp. TaxID=1962951 RepID=UPI0025C35EB9|nr:phosphoribosylglycinamide formyltransferase [Desulfonatronospira sp.]